MKMKKKTVCIISNKNNEKQQKGNKEM